jgi:hypothetical protein
MSGRATVMIKRGLKVRRSESPTHLHQVAEHEWGWHSREDPRMHLETVDEGTRKGPLHATVWLESNGRRVFDVELHGDMRAKDWKTLRLAVTRDRWRLEGAWIRFMLDNRWLKVDRKGPLVTLRMYPSFGHRREHVLDLRKLFSKDYYDDLVTSRRVLRVDFDRELVVLRIGTEERPDDRDFFPLADLVFRG